jgi:hypothetical protein
VQVYIAQAPFDDLFSLTEDSKADEDVLTRSNLDAFARIACEKYFRREFELVGNTPRIIILRGDIKRSGETFSKTSAASQGAESKPARRTLAAGSRIDRCW